MNKWRISLFVITIIFNGFFTHAQENKSLIPSCTVKDAYGEKIDTATLSNNGKPFLICFWKTCCKAPVNMLDAIAEQYDDWRTETGVVVYAVSIDDTRSSKTVPVFANSKGWEFTVLLDENSEFKRAMNVILTPHLFLFNGSGRIIWQKTTWFPGDEEEVYEQLKKLNK